MTFFTYSYVKLETWYWKVSIQVATIAQILTPENVKFLFLSNLLVSLLDNTRNDTIPSGRGVQCVF